MLVVIPHPTETLKLRNLQKQIISHMVELYGNDYLFIPHFPLWIDISSHFAESNNFSTSDLKKLGKTINQINLKEFQIIEDKLCINTELIINNQITNTNLCLFLVKNKKSDKKFALPVGFLETLKEFLVFVPPTLKIFRIGSSNQKTLYEKEISICDSIWIKL